MTLQTVSLNRSYGGTQGVYRHASEQPQPPMTFSVYVPPHREGTKLAAVWYLSGLTCTHANVTEKGEFRSARRTRADLHCFRHQPEGRRRSGRSSEFIRFRLGRGFLC